MLSLLTFFNQVILTQYYFRFFLGVCLLGGGSFRRHRSWKPTISGINMDVSENSGTPKSSILIGFSIINHLFWGTPIFGNTHILQTLFFREAPELCSYLQVIDDLQISLPVAPEDEFVFSFWKPCQSVKVSMGMFPKMVGFPPKWMVKIMENPIKMDDFGGYHYFRKPPWRYKRVHLKWEWMGENMDSLIFSINLELPPSFSPNSLLLGFLMQL